MKRNTQEKNSQLYLHLCVSILLSFISSECSKILSLIIYFLLQGLPFKGCSAKNKFLVFLHLKICFTFLFIPKRHFHCIYKLSFTILSSIFQMLCHIILAPIVIDQKTGVIEICLGLKVMSHFLLSVFKTFSLPLVCSSL